MQWILITFCGLALVFFIVILILTFSDNSGNNSFDFFCSVEWMIVKYNHMIGFRLQFIFSHSLQRIHQWHRGGVDVALSQLYIHRTFRYWKPLTLLHELLCFAEWCLFSCWLQVVEYRDVNSTYWEVTDIVCHDHNFSFPLHISNIDKMNCVWLFLFFLLFQDTNQ